MYSRTIQFLKFVLDIQSSTCQMNKANLQQFQSRDKPNRVFATHMNGVEIIAENWVGVKLIIDILFLNSIMKIKIFFKMISL